MYHKIKKRLKAGDAIFTTWSNNVAMVKTVFPDGDYGIEWSTNPGKVWRYGSDRILSHQEHKWKTLYQKGESVKSKWDGKSHTPHDFILCVMISH